VWRWLAAEPRDVVDLAGAGTLGAGSDELRLGDELRHWRGVVSRRRLLVLLRRHAAVALGLAALLEALALLGAFPQWVVVAVPLAALIVSVSIFASRGPSPFELARLLDDKLGLNDRLATALQIEAHGGGAQSALERRTVADAAALLQAGRGDWRASAAPVGRDGWALLVPLAALAVVIAIGAATGGTSSSGPTEALAPHAGAGVGNSPNEKHRKGGKGNKSHAAPTGKLHKFKTKKVPPSGISSEEASKEGYRQIPLGTKSGKAGEGGKGGASGKSGSKKAPGRIQKAAEGKAGANEGGAGNKDSNGPKAKREDEHPTVGFNVKNQKKKGDHGRPGASEVGGGAGKKAAPNGQGDESTSSQAGHQPSGKPSSGSGKAGGEEGNNSQGHATPITGQASQTVKIQPSYAPSRSSKGGKEKNKAGVSQGAGGKARTATVTGGTQVGDEFSYVPAAGGAVPGPSAGLQLNYLRSLKFVERLPW
jgi:hypothetical protein